MKFLPDDVARCHGVFDEDEGEIYWREGCENCLRRTSPVSDPGRARMIEPPEIIALWCEYLIEYPMLDDLEAAIAAAVNAAAVLAHVEPE